MPKGQYVRTPETLARARETLAKARAVQAGNPRTPRQIAAFDIARSKANGLHRGRSKSKKQVITYEQLKFLRKQNLLQTSSALSPELSAIVQEQAKDDNTVQWSQRGILSLDAPIDEVGTTLYDIIGQ